MEEIDFSKCNERKLWIKFTRHPILDMKTVDIDSIEEEYYKSKNQQKKLDFLRNKLNFLEKEKLAQLKAESYLPNSEYAWDASISLEDDSSLEPQSDSLLQSESFWAFSLSSDIDPSKKERLGLYKELLVKLESILNTLNKSADNLERVNYLTSRIDSIRLKIEKEYSK